MNIKVSIIIPVYKVEDYIEKCIYSIINQTYYNIECILVDDCSPDRSIIKAKNLISNYRGEIEFRIIKHEINKGLSSARNTGIHEATGDYIYFLDSDDYIIPECIDLMVNMILKYPNVELVQAGAISELSFLDIENKNITFEFTDNKQWIKSAILEKEKIPLTSWNKLLNRQFLLRNKLFFKEGIIHEDELFNFYLAKYLSSIAFCKRNTYVYIKREGSIMTSANSKSINSWKKILYDYINHIDPFCRLEQKKAINNELLPRYVFNNYDDKEDYRELYLLLSKQCSIIGRFIINLLLNTPDFIIKRKIFYNFFKNKLSDFL